MAPGEQPRGGRVSQRAPTASTCTPLGRVSALFHEGERAVQQRAGVERVAAQVGRNILSLLPPGFGAFLSRQPFVVVASQDQPGRVWASLIAGGAGFARALDDRQILLAGRPAPGDPLEGALEQAQAQIGVLAIEFGTRQRIRLNGIAQRTGEGVVLTVTEAFGNCPKYIQRRLLAGQPTGPAAPAPRGSEALDARQAALVRRADTFFIASAHPKRGARGAPGPHSAPAGSAGPKIWSRDRPSPAPDVIVLAHCTGWKATHAIARRLHPKQRRRYLRPTAAPAT